MTDQLTYYRVSEIYRTIQGEGTHAGLPCTLIRLQGCTLCCKFCDTPYAQDLKGGARLPLSMLMHKVKTLYHTGDILLLTGGEPTTYGLDPLLNRLQDLGPVHLETNGLWWQPERVLDMITWITLSPKPANPSVQRCILDRANEIKWLIARDEDVTSLLLFLDNLRVSRYRTSLEAVSPSVCVQPISQDPAATEIAYAACLEYGWRLSLQMHKYLGVK